MGVSKTDGPGVAPAAQPAAEPDEAPQADAPAEPAKNEPLVKRWEAGEVPAAVSGNATVFEAKSGGGPAAAAPVKGPGKGPTPGSYPTVADTQRIADNPDPAARNLDI